MPLIDTANGPLWYADHRGSRPERPALLLIHGAGGTHLDWPGELRRLPMAGVLAPDLPGHGKSPGPGRTRVDDYAADIIALLDALDIPAAVAAGHSMGGAIALTMALDYPARVRGLVLLGTGARLGVHPDLLHLSQDKARAVSMIVNGFWGPDAAAEPVRQFSTQHLMSVDTDVLQGDFTACAAYDVRERLGEITQPTLVIGGEHDAMTPLKYSTYLHEHIAGSRLVVVPGAAHMMALQQPRLVADSVGAWLETLPR